MNLFKQAITNIGDTFGSAKSLLEVLAQPIAGAAIYTGVPSALQGWFNVDMTGWKMPIVGTAAGLVVGAIFRKPGVIAGTLGGLGAHLGYAKFNSAYKAIFKTYIPRFDPNVVATFADDAMAMNAGTQSANMQQAVEQRALPGGDSVALFTPQHTYEATAMPNQTRASVRIKPAPAQPTMPSRSTQPALNAAMSDNGNAAGLYDNNAVALNDNNAVALSDNNATALSDKHFYDSLMDNHNSSNGNASSLYSDAGGDESYLFA